MNNFNTRIKEIYIILKFKTQQDFANALGVSVSYIGHLFSGRRATLSESIKKLLHNTYRVNIHWLETGEGEPFVSQVAEDCAPYATGPVAAELLSVIAQLDAADQERILQEAKDRLLLKKLKEQIDRGQPGGGSQERQRPAIPPHQTKKGRRQTA